MIMNDKLYRKCSQTKSSPMGSQAMADDHDIDNDTHNNKAYDTQTDSDGLCDTGTDNCRISCEKALH